MKSIIRYSFTILLILSALIIVPACKLSQATDDDDLSGTPESTATTTVPTSTTSTTVTTTTTTTTASSTASVDLSSGRPVSFPDTLFIGDSRSVGLKEYGKLSEATFFCSVGLNSYKVTSEAVDVPGFGKLKLEALLDKKQFDRVYVMLGINELGYNLESTTQKYRDLITLIHSKQPDAKVIINGTLHVTKACDDISSGNKAIFTNTRIDEFNNLIAALADNQKVFYLDINPAFDDVGGNMTAEYAAGDGIHIKAKYYLLWRDYLDTHRIA